MRVGGDAKPLKRIKGDMPMKKTTTLACAAALLAAGSLVAAPAFAQNAEGGAAGGPKKVKLLDKPLWVMFTHDLPGKRETVDPKVWAAHLASDEAQEKDGTRVMGGGVSDKDGKREFGMIVFRAKNYEEALKIANADPAVQAGERTVDVHQWQINEGRLNVTVDFSDSAAQFH
jgi:uncharacterized protein